MDEVNFGNVSKDWDEIDFTDYYLSEVLTWETSPECVLNSNIFFSSNMQESVQRLVSKKHGCGIDGIATNQYMRYWRINKNRILKDLRKGRYMPQPVLLTDIWKSNGGKREIAKYTCTDRVILDVVKRALAPVLDKYASKYSYAYQEGKGVEEAVKQAAIYIEEGKRYVLEIDIKDFFDNINLERLERMLRNYIGDEKLWQLLHRYLYITVVDDYMRKTKTLGLVQGSPISPILSNLYMEEFDRYMEKNYAFCRFADDINVYFETEEEAIEANIIIREYLCSKLGLECNEKKSGVHEAIKRPFLGYEFYQMKCSPQVYVRRSTKGKKEIYRNWHKTALQKTGEDYHIVNDGILGKHDFSLLFENPDSKVYIPVESCNSINIYSSVMFGSNFLQLMNEKNLVLNIFDKYGRFIGTFHTYNHSRTGKILLQQVSIYNDAKRRLEIAKKLELASIHNQRENLRYYYKHSRNMELQTAILELTKSMNEIKDAESVEAMLLVEARARQSYLHQMDSMIRNDEFLFDKRTRQPPENELNALISFGNVFLYQRIATEIYKSPLDIRIGILHATNSRPETLNLDIAEIFKPIIVDKTIFRVIHNLEIQAKKHFERKDENVVYLNKEGKKVFIRALEQALERKITVDGQQMSYRALIRLEIRKYCDFVENGTKYKPFKYT